MNITEYAKMAEEESHHWWHLGKMHFVEDLIKRTYSPKKQLKILELGCGTGHFTQRLKKYGKVLGADISVEALKVCRNRGITNTKKVDITKMTPSVFGGEKYDLVLALDVLEHIQDDLNVMERTHRILADDGLFIITVPAYKFLWSDHDEALHHKRRYRSVELTTKLTDAGFEIVHKTHYVAFLFPAIFAYRMFRNIFSRDVYPKTSYFMLPSLLNRFLFFLLKIETRLSQLFYLPVGTTFAVVARKREL